MIHLTASDEHGPQFRVEFVETDGYDSYPECLTNGKVGELGPAGESWHYTQWADFFGGRVVLDLELNHPMEVRSLRLGQMEGVTFNLPEHRHHGCEGKTSKPSSLVQLLAAHARGEFRKVGVLVPRIVREEGERRLWEFRFSGPAFRADRLRICCERPEDCSAPTMIDEIVLNDVPNDAFSLGVWRLKRKPLPHPVPRNPWSPEEYFELARQKPYRPGEVPPREPLLQMEGQPVRTPADWQKKRERMMADYFDFFGRFPARSGDPRVELLLDEIRDGIRWRELALWVGPGDDPFLDRMPLYLLTPEDVSAPVPVVIALHPTIYSGKEEAVGLDGYSFRDLSGILLERGYALASPDAVYFGERCPDADPKLMYALASHGMCFYRRHPDWSFMGKMAWDVSRLIDYLETLPELDTDRIGVVGHSHGSYHTLHAAINDQRVKAAVASGHPPEVDTPDAMRAWGQNWGCFPKLLLYENVPESAPLDIEHLLSLVAPRPLMLIPECGVLDLWQDRIEERGVREVYRLHDAEDRVSIYPHPYGHAFLDRDRTASAHFFDRWLKPHHR